MSSEKRSIQLFIIKHKPMKVFTEKIPTQYHFTKNNFYDSQKKVHHDTHFKEEYRSWHRNAKRGKNSL